jgi:hypothetical protein
MIQSSGNFRDGRCSHKLSKPKRMASLVAAVVLLGATLDLGSYRAIAAPDVPYLVSAFKAAEKKPTDPGISATITLTSLGANSKPPKVLIAQGPLAMEGDLLGGRLPMTFDNASSLEKDRNILFFNVSKTGRIGLQWLVDNKPFGGPMQSFDTDASGSTLTKKIDWQGVTRQITVSFERKLTFLPGVIRRPKPGPVIVGTIPLKPTSTPKPTLKPIITGGIRLAPKGRQVRVTARLVVTNSEDGVGGIFGNSDKEVELGGGIRFGNQNAFAFNNQSAHDGSEFKSKSMQSVRLTYSDPDHRFFSVSGNVWDKDKASASDTLWIANERIDLIKIMESNQEYVIRGDRKSESADLYIRVVDEGEFR